MATKIQLRRDTAANWTAANPILADGEKGIETDTGFEKNGNGVSAWNALPYRTDGSVFASTTEAQTGTNNSKGMTPLTNADSTVRAVPSPSAGGRNIFVKSSGAVLGANTDAAVLLGGTTSMPNIIGTGVSLGTILGGYDHEIVQGIASTIVGGGHNTSDATDGHTFIGGGSYQETHGAYGVAVGGFTNKTHTGPYNTVGGGRQNEAGLLNDNTRSDATVAGGYLNTATGLQSSIGGGRQNNASGADSSIGGGRQNTASGTGSVTNGGVSNTASGNNSSIVGGQANAAGGEFSIAGGGGCSASAQHTVSLGDSNIASGLGSVALGRRAVSNLDGKHTFANGQFAAIGDAQSSLIVAKRLTTVATAVDLGLSGTAGSGPITMPNDTTWAFSIMVVARRTDVDGESAAYRFEGCIKRDTNALSTAIVGTVTKTVIAETTAAWDCNVGADTTNGALQITVTGEATKTIRWVARIELTEVSG